MTDGNHSRLRQYIIKFCDASGSFDQEKTREMFDVILFKGSGKLRGHAVQHFANSEEMDVWKQVVSAVDATGIAEVVNGIREIGCPFFQGVTRIEPPCKKRKCSLFRKCTPLARPLEDQYLECIEKIIQEAGDLPRYVSYENRRGSFFRLLPTLRIKMIFQGHTGYHNLLTCYRPGQGSNLTWRHFLDEQKREISNEGGSTVKWCDREHWEISGAPDRVSKSSARKKRGAKKGGKTKSCGRKNRYHAGGRSWRDYIEDEWD